MDRRTQHGKRRTIASGIHLSDAGVDDSRCQSAPPSMHGNRGAGNSDEYYGCTVSGPDSERHTHLRRHQNVATGDDSGSLGGRFTRVASHTVHLIEHRPRLFGDG
jgi:hypothetical protein